MPHSNASAVIPEAAPTEPENLAPGQLPLPGYTEPPKKKRGFGGMDPARVSEIASKGGKAAHKAGTAHKFTSEEAAAAGKKGGIAPHVRRGKSLVRPKDDAKEPVTS